MKLDKNSNVPLYVQIYNLFAEEITKGYLSEGDALPTRRALCQQLNVSQATAENAYSRLISDGYITSRPGSGYYVSIPPSESEQTQSSHAKEIYNFSSNGVETSKLPFDKWSRLMKQTLKNDAELFQHGEKLGEYALRNSIRKMLFRTQGIRCKISQVIIGPGGEDLMRELFLLLAYKNPILMNNYYHYRIKAIANAVHKTPIYLPNGSQGIDIDALITHDRAFFIKNPLTIFLQA